VSSSDTTPRSRSCKSKSAWPTPDLAKEENPEHYRSPNRTYERCTLLAQARRRVAGQKSRLSRYGGQLAKNSRSSKVSIPITSPE